MLVLRGVPKFSTSQVVGNGISEPSTVALPSLKLTAKAPKNRPSQKEISSSNHPFSGAMLVLGSVNS